MPGEAVVNSISSLHINDQKSWRGGEQQVLYLLKGLNERGHRADLAAQPGSALGEQARSAGVAVHSVPMRGEADLLAARRVSRIVRDGKYNIVHMHTAHAHMLGLLACAFNKKPLCIVSRRVINPIRRTPLGLPALKYRWRVDHYLAISHAVKQTLIAGGIDSGRISIVHSGVAPVAPPAGSRERVRQSLGIAAAAPVAGAVGALVAHKGQRELVEAVPIILKRIPAARFIMVGEGELRKSLEEMASGFGVNDAIMFPGFRADARSFISAFDVFVAPSHMEGLNTSIIDAMMLGRAVVATRVGGIPELIEHETNGLLVPPRHPAALAAAIVDLLENPEKAQRLAAAGQARAMNGFTADHMVEGTLDVYAQLLTKKWKT